VYSPLGQFISAIIPHIRLCRSSCSQQKGKMSYFLLSNHIDDLEGKIFTKFPLSEWRYVECSVKYCKKQKKGIAILKSQRRRSSCKQVVQLHLLFLRALCSRSLFTWNNVLSAYSFQSHWAFFPHGQQGGVPLRTPGEGQRPQFCTPKAGLPAAAPGYRLYSGCLPRSSLLIMFDAKLKSAPMSESNRSRRPDAGNSSTACMGGLPGTRLWGAVPHPKTSSSTWGKPGDFPLPGLR